MTWTAGEKLRASKLNQMGAVVGRNQRTTTISTPAAIIRVISVRAPVVSGRTYRVSLFTESESNIAGTISQHELRFTTNDTEPTTTSTVMQRTVVRHDTAAVPDLTCIEAIYPAAFTGFLRVAYCIFRAVGTGAVGSTAAATYPTTLTVEDLGTTVPTTGTVY